MSDSIQVPISKRIVLINSVSGIVTRVLTVGVFAWVIQYLMKRISDEELALLPIVMSIAMALPVLQSVLSSGLARFVTESYAKNDFAGITKIVSSQFPLLLAGGVLSMFLGTFVAWNIQHILTIPPQYVDKARLMMLMIFGRMAVGIMLAPFSTGLFARQRFVLQNSIEIAASLVRIALMLWLILAFGPQVEFVIGAQVASQLFQLISTTYVSMRLLPALRFRWSSFDVTTCKRVLTFGGWNFLMQSSNLIRRAADAPLLNLLSTAVAVNDFFLGSTFDTQLRQTTIIASQPLMPALTAMHAREQHDRLASAFVRGGRILLWASMFFAVPLMIFSYDLFSLYLGRVYREHVDAATVMIILLLGFPLIYPSAMFLRIAYARENIRSIAIRSICGNLANLALTIVLVGPIQMGAIGSAIATLISCLSHPFFYWPLALRTLNVTWSRFIRQTLVPGLTPAVAATVAGLITSQCINSVLLRVIIGILVCMFVYALVVVIVLQPPDRADLRRLRQKARSS